MSPHQRDVEGADVDSEEASRGTTQTFGCLWEGIYLPGMEMTDLGAFFWIWECKIGRTHTPLHLSGKSQGRLTDAVILGVTGEIQVAMPPAERLKRASWRTG